MRGLWILAVVPLVCGAAERRSKLERRLTMPLFAGHGLDAATGPGATKAKAAAAQLLRKCVTTRKRLLIVGFHRDLRTWRAETSCLTKPLPPAAVPFVFNALIDERHFDERHGSDSFSARIFQSVAQTGRTDIVQPLIVALTRIELRRQHSSQFRAESTVGRQPFTAIEKALEFVTYHRVRRRDWHDTWENFDGSVSSDAYCGPGICDKKGCLIGIGSAATGSRSKLWAKWWQANSGQSRDAWRKKAIAAARALALAVDDKRRVAGLRRMLQIRKTHHEAKRLVKQHKLEANKCLQQVQPSD